MPEISLEGLKRSVMRCEDCALLKHGCARVQARSAGQGCKGYLDTSGIEVSEAEASSGGVSFRVALHLDREALEVVVSKEKRPGTAVWGPAVVRLWEREAVPPGRARSFGRVLDRASSVAEYLDRELD